MKLPLVILFLFIVCDGYSQSQNRTWVIRGNTGAFIGLANVSIEKAFSLRHSVSLAPSYGYFRSNQFTYETYGAGIEYRYYFLKKDSSPKGYYVATGISFATGKAIVETTNITTDVNGFTPHLVAGKQWIFKKGFTIDANVGIQYVKLDFKNKEYQGAYKGFLPALGVGVGYAF